MTKRKHAKFRSFLAGPFQDAAEPVEIFQSALFHSVIETRDQGGFHYRSETYKFVRQSSQLDFSESTYVNNLPEVRKLLSPEQGTPFIEDENDRGTKRRKAKSSRNIKIQKKRKINRLGAEAKRSIKISDGKVISE